MGKLGLFPGPFYREGGAFGIWWLGNWFFLLQECSDLVELPFPGLVDALSPLEYGLHCLFPWDLGSELLWGLGGLTATGWGVRARRV